MINRERGEESVTPWGEEREIEVRNRSETARDEGEITSVATESEVRTSGSFESEEFVRNEGERVASSGIRDE